MYLCDNIFSLYGILLVTISNLRVWLGIYRIFCGKIIKQPTTYGMCFNGDFRGDTWFFVSIFQVLNSWMNEFQSVSTYQLINSWEESDFQTTLHQTISMELAGEPIIWNYI